MPQKKPMVFISRDLSSISPLMTLQDHLTIVGKSLLSFDSVKIGDLPDVDWIFFYSRQGVFHFLGQKKEIPPKIKLAAFGLKTGESLRSLGRQVSFTGNGVAEKTAKAFSLIAHGDRVLFARARQSRKSLQNLLTGVIEMVDLVVYDNQPMPSVEIPFCDLLIFTSPLNATSYFQSHTVSKNQKFVAIGSTTKNHLHKMGVTDVEVPEEPTEQALVHLVQKHFSL